MSLVIALLGALRASLRTRTDLAFENLALRQQLVLLRRPSKATAIGASMDEKIRFRKRSLRPARQGSSGPFSFLSTASLGARTDAFLQANPSDSSRCRAPGVSLGRSRAAGSRAGSEREPAPSVSWGSSAFLSTAGVLYASVNGALSGRSDRLAPKLGQEGLQSPRRPRVCEGFGRRVRAVVRETQPQNPEEI